MRGALLVAHEDVADGILMEYRVVDRQDGAAGIAEDHVDALILQGFDDHFGTAHLLHHGPSPSGSLEFRATKKARVRGLGLSAVVGVGSDPSHLRRSAYDKDVTQGSRTR